MAAFILANIGWLAAVLAFLIAALFAYLVRKGALNDTIAIAIVNAIDPLLPELEKVAKASSMPWDDLLLAYVVNPVMERLRKLGLSGMASANARLHALKVAKRFVPAEVVDRVTTARSGLVQSPRF